MIFQHFVLLVVTGSQLAFALPASKSAGSADIKHVKQHTHEDSYYRRDSVLIYARGSNCSPLTLEQLKGLPGWPKIEKYASDTYGDGGVNIVVNPPEYLDSPAVVCSQDGVVQIQVEGEPTCSTSTNHMVGQIDGTEGEHELDLEQSYSNTGSWSVTQESSLSIGAELSISVGIPAIEEVSAKITTSTTFSNSLGKSFSTTVTEVSKQSVKYHVASGQKCDGTLTTKVCNIQGKGSTAFVASGYVWFNYEDSRPPKSDPNGSSHYKYAIDIASVLTDINDRSSTMSFSGSMATSSESHSDVICNPPAAKTKKANVTKSKHS